MKHDVCVRCGMSRDEERRDQRGCWAYVKYDHHIWTWDCDGKCDEHKN